MKTGIIFILLMLSINLFSQNQNSEIYSFGFKAGLDFSMISVNNNFNMGTGNFALTYHAGILFNVEYFKNILFQTELQYNLKGSNFTDGYIENYIYLEYYEADLLIAYKTSSIINVYAGIYAAYLKNKSFDQYCGFFNDCYEDEENPLNTIENYSYNNKDFGFIVGMIFDIDNFFIDTRFSQGIISIINEPEISSYNREFSVSFGYKF